MRAISSFIYYNFKPHFLRPLPLTSKIHALAIVYVHEFCHAITAHLLLPSPTFTKIEIFSPYSARTTFSWRSQSSFNKNYEAISIAAAGPIGQALQALLINRTATLLKKKAENRKKHTSSYYLLKGSYLLLKTWEITLASGLLSYALSPLQGARKASNDFYAISTLSGVPAPFLSLPFALLALYSVYKTSAQTRVFILCTRVGLTVLPKVCA